ncbi:MAG: nitronate monooxygenase [Chloroflexota bacterium]
MSSLRRPIAYRLPRVVLPVVAAGGIADGAGRAAVLMLGTEGALIGTHFLATPESPLPASFKQAICRSGGHDTLLSELPDVINGSVWPRAFARVLRTPFIWVLSIETRCHRAPRRQAASHGLSRSQSIPLAANGATH